MFIQFSKKAYKSISLENVSDFFDIMNDLLKKLKRKQITIKLNNNQLDIKAPKGAMTPELLSEIKEHKQALISFMSEYQLKENAKAVIPVSPKKINYYLSSSQHRLWLLHQLENENSAYNMPSIYDLKGTLTIEQLEKAFFKLIERHEILRTNIVIEEKTGIPKQQINPLDQGAFKINRIDLSKDIAIDTKLTSIIKNEINYSFNLASDRLYRVTLLKKAENSYVLISVIHHIISDGWSSSVLIKDLFTIYSSMSTSTPFAMEPLPIQYKDYAEWQQSYLKSNAIEIDKSYWLNQFKETVSTLNIPTYNSRPSIKTYTGKTVQKSFDKVTINRFKEICKKEGATLFMGLMSAVKVLLYKYTNQSDIVIGSPFAGRELPELQHQIGFYVNTVGLVSSLKKKATFIEFLHQVKKTTLDAQEHQQYPFDELIKSLQVTNDRSRNPLFDVVLSLDIIENTKNSIDNLAIEEIAIEGTTSKFDLEFAFKEEGNNSQLFLTFNTAIYTEDFVTQATHHLEVLLESIVNNPITTLDALAYLTAQEKTVLLEDFNDTTVDFKCASKNYITLFKEQVKKNPNAIAIAFEEKKYTYKELDELSNALANYLLTKYNIVIEDFIGVKLERSDWLIVSFLAVLKTGAAYVPIDLAYPEERISFIESDSNCKAIIDDLVVSSFINGHHKDITPPNVTINHTNLAYVIYTSGSTGLPKGTLVEHKQLLNLCFWHIQQYNVTSASKGTLYSGIAFDASIWEITPYLVAGATLYPISDKATRLNIDTLTSFLHKNNITHSYLPTSITHELVTNTIELENITILTGGDTLKIKETPKFKIYNNYGPTENTVVTTFFDLQDGFNTSIPIGKPISNTNCYILSDNLTLQAIGIPGKLYVSGAGVTRGYLNNEELTAKLFIENSFVKGEKMYDTGDLAKWLPDGNIEFLGRKDSQVKIRGHRIELTEIENVITQFSNTIKQAVLNVRTTENGLQLEAYYVAKLPIKNKALRDFLQEKLPAYMVPSHYMDLETIPITANGKIDSKNLPIIAENLQANKKYLAPRNTFEKQVVNIWEEVLGIEKIGITDNFFELGGHSLLVGQIINRIHKELDKSISFKAFFETPTIKGINEKLSDGNTYAIIPKATDKAYYPLTSAQYRIWSLCQLDEESLAYNMSGAFKITGALDITKFENAFKTAIKRHEILRTQFKENELGEIYQHITKKNAFQFKITEKDVSNLTKEEIEHVLENESNTVFDLENDLLLRATLLKTAADAYILFLTMHHIIGDGWSMELLTSEIITNYNNTNHHLQELRIQYKDFAVWEQSAKQHEKYIASEKFWLEQFQEEVIPKLTLPSFKKRPLTNRYLGNEISYAFPKTLLQDLKELSKTHEVTLFMILTTGLNILFHRYSGNKQIVLGTPISGRTHADLEDQIGLYINTLALKTNIEGNMSFLDILKNQKKLLTNAYEHQNYPFDELVDKLNLKRETNRSPLFDVMVVLQNQSQLQQFNDHKKLDQLNVGTYDFKRKTSQFDISLAFEELDTLYVTAEYNTDIYDEYLVNRLFSHLKNLFTEFVKTPEILVKNSNYLNENEQESLLKNINIQQDTITNLPAIPSTKNQLLINVDLLDKALLLNTKVLVLDTYQQLLPTGIEGTLYVKYPDPVNKEEGTSTHQFLNSNSVGKWHKDGSLEIIEDTTSLETKHQKPINIKLNDDDDEAILKIKQLFLKRLKVTDIEITAVFFEQGGTSIKAIQAIRDVNKEFGVKMSIVDFIKAPTVYGVFQKIKANTSDDNQLYINFNTFQKEKKTLFLIPPIVGKSIIYKPLCDKLNEDFNCIGFDYPVVKTKNFVAETTRLYVKTIKELSNTPNVIILGYSIGALLAFEVAKILTKEQFNPQLILIDRPPTLKNETVALTDVDVSQVYENHKPFFEDIDAIEKELNFKTTITQVLQEASTYYTNGQVPADALAFEASKNSEQGYMYQWKPFIEGALDVVSLHGDHFDFMNSENMELIINNIKNKCLEHPISII